ncbi:uncharacterized protein KD926_001467 [Aspergillus affinis]|uniref:uncharacterized protein n=1 Tax=Aspergillus affinis TaxID=1070780 RepID=UPI0022FE623C|nr:uncharacterized protein KD926_001467 [Aspergillus affinis]KAI9044237.1 hypothetical protein KD926_001467 [Aspergillus affinis]
MAIHPSLRPQSDAQGHLSPQQTRAISAWTEQATASLENLTISETVPTAQNAACSESTHGGGALRGATVSLSIPLDDPTDHQPTTRTSFLAANQSQKYPSASFRRREPLRRDSLKRREALLKGKDGSRRRQRWENGHLFYKDRLLHNPWAEPPSPKDWDIRPTYTRHDPMPYYLAPLWDVHYAHMDRTSSNQTTKGTRNEIYHIPKELRSKLKHTRAARGMLQDLEEDIRQFIQRWNEKQRLLRKEGLADAPQTSDEDSEDEIVFVGRNGQMHDSPARKQKLHQMSQAMTAHNERDGEKMVFESLADDRAAAFGRWLVHSIASYYGLHTWSVTVGEPARREAYVGFRPPTGGSRATGLFGDPTGSGTCHREAMNQTEDELPRPLWAQV